MNKQLFFEFSQNKKFNNADIITSDFNKDIYNFLFVKQDKWLTNCIFIFGNKGVGKSYILHTFLQNKSFIEISLKDEDLELNLEKIVKDFDYILLEDINNLSLIEEKIVFALYNFAFSFNKKLLITADKEVKSLNINLPDLKSRLEYSLSFHIKDPDDKSLKMILFKGLSDKQILINPDVLEYIFKIMPRDAHKVQEIIQKLEKFILEEKKSITIYNIKSILYV